MFKVSQMARKGFFIVTILVITSGAGKQTRATKPCPTNKIAPHRRISNWENRIQHRTFGLFDPNRMQNPPPQSYELDDCGDIEDYDENDLSSLISPVKRQERPGRLFFNAFQTQLEQQEQHRPPPSNHHQSQQGVYGQDNHGQEGLRPPYQPTRPPYQPTRPPYQPTRPPYQPTRPPYQPTRPPYQPTRPPYRPRPTNYPPPRPQFASGQNHRPPVQYLSNNVRPVYEGNPYFDEAPTTYRPNIVGGPLGHVVGVTIPSSTERINKNIPYTRPENPRNNNYSQTILGSFIDLLFR